MEIYMVKTKFHHLGYQEDDERTETTPRSTKLYKDSKQQQTTTTAPTTTISNNESFIQFISNSTNTNYINNTLLLWNTAAVANIAAFSSTGNDTSNLTYDAGGDEYEILADDDGGLSNISLLSSVLPPAENVSSWGFCLEWSVAQNDMFQIANFFFAAAFCVPPSFKQSVLLVRALLAAGFIFCTIWGGMEICAFDILLWNLTISTLNILHTVILTWRFLPPALTLELTELYLKVFKPLRVSKKHFKELTREAQILTLEKGDIYAVEDVSSADERLSILLRGKLRVTCDDTHLHFIHGHQFIDSPEWESNHEQSDDVFQVTITAEEDSVYLCWPRMRLERVLRHRPTVKVVLDSIIGKDITQKLYSLNEHIRNSREIETERLNKKAASYWMSRSLSVDAVNTGKRGHVRSFAWKTEQRRPSITCSDINSPLRQSTAQCWVPLQANHFMPTSPFLNPRQPTLPSEHYQQVTQPLLPTATAASSTEFTTYPSTDGLLSVPPPVITTAPLEKKRSFRNSFRRNKDSKTTVKFQKQVQEVTYDSLPQRPN